MMTLKMMKMTTVDQNLQFKQISKVKCVKEINLDMSNLATNLLSLNEINSLLKVVDNLQSQINKISQGEILK